MAQKEKFTHIFWLIKLSLLQTSFNNNLINKIILSNPIHNLLIMDKTNTKQN